MYRWHRLAKSSSDHVSQVLPVSPPPEKTVLSLKTNLSRKYLFLIGIEHRQKNWLHCKDGHLFTDNNDNWRGYQEEFDPLLVVHDCDQMEQRNYVAEENNRKCKGSMHSYESIYLVLLNNDTHKYHQREESVGRMIQHLLPGRGWWTEKVLLPSDFFGGNGFEC